MLINTSFDVRSDSNGQDPDKFSPTLRRYHKLLWSKPLPDGVPFTLDETTGGAYLHHRSERGEFFLSSDSIIATIYGRPSISRIVGHLPPAMNEDFMQIACTIGGYLIWPSNQVEGRGSINQDRGWRYGYVIADRIDLTLECIRRHYQGEWSPLQATLERYRYFFDLFEDFRGYVKFFLLQDLVTSDYSAGQFFMSFDDFNGPSLPGGVDSYAEYRRRSIEFVTARNRRIDKWIDDRPNMSNTEGA